MGILLDLKSTSFHTDGHGVSRSFFVTNWIFSRPILTKPKRASSFGSSDLTETLASPSVRGYKVLSSRFHISEGGWMLFGIKVSASSAAGAEGETIGTQATARQGQRANTIGTPTTARQGLPCDVAGFHLGIMRMTRSTSASSDV